jgi:endonuclease/exonuclease/phosphatase family metal-dependent hydrolase
MEKIRVATFNVENLFARYNFRKNFEPNGDDGFTINNLAFDVYNETEKIITAKAIRKMDADIICLQEVESLPVLDRFNSWKLASLKYKHRMLIDGNDPRQIDVAVLSRYPISRIKSHRDERSGTSPLFSRDCLEVIIDVEDKQLHLYINHFKSMIGGRDDTSSRRKAQSDRVVELIEKDWKDKSYEGNFIVLGDFNDYLDDNSSIANLVHHEGLVNVIERLPEPEQWTHYYKSKGEYRQIDFSLLSKSLAGNNPNDPVIMREGLPYRADKYTGNRFDEIGEDNPKASDHCGIYMDIELD